MIEYRIAKKSDIPDIAKINLESTPNGMRAKLGVDLTIKMFEKFYDENPIFIVAISSGLVVGYVMGYFRGSKAKEIYQKANNMIINFRLLKLSMQKEEKAIHMLKNNFKNIFLHYKMENNKFEDINNVDAVLYSISVLQKYGGKGIGYNLVKQFKELLLSKNIKNFCLSTGSKNYYAQKLYKKSGMKLIEKNDDFYWYYEDIDTINADKDDI